MYIDTLISKDIDLYIDVLINQVYSILPLYEEQLNEAELISKIDNITSKIDGFLILYKYDQVLSLDILLLLTRAKSVNTHKELRSCVLKICSLLSEIKQGGLVP